MMKRLFGSVLLSLALLAGVFGMGSLVAPASAQVTTGLQQVGETIKLPSTDPRIIAARIINVALGLIGIVLVVLILYGGFVYMTSGGAEDKIATAKKIITNAIIGLVIILSAWAITRFVIERLLSATQEGGGGVVTGTGGGGLGGGFAGGGGAEAFRVKSINPTGSVSIRNVQVKVVFNKAVDPASTSAVVVMKDGGATVAGTAEVSGFVLTFTPTAVCPAPNADRKCFDANADFVVKVGSGARSVSGQSVTCTGFGSTCEGKFHTGSLVDTRVPTVKLTYPTDGMSVKANSLQKVLADAADDAGVAAVEFFEGSNSIGVDGPTVSTTPLTFAAKADWLTSSASLGTRVLSALAKDIDSNESSRSSVTVVVRPEHCFNGKVDTPSETGVDCGGDSSSAEYCGACAGGSCTKDADCSSGFCVAGKCVVQPIISGVSPLDGKSGTFVTLSGTNFGYALGTVTFLGGPGTADDRVAAAPSVCTAAGVTTWTNTQTVVEVPVGAASGPIQIKNGTSGLTDATNDAGGPSIPNFVVNSKEYPGLCAVTPSAGSSGAFVEAVGDHFGSAGKMLFTSESKTVEASVDTWSATRVKFKVPVVNIGDQNISVKTASAESNKVIFTVTEKVLTAPPAISSLDPTAGPQQQYVTIFGSNFGYSLGKVIFTAADGSRALGDTSFPAGCSDAFWRDDRIVIKVPTTFQSGKATEGGTYKVKVERPDSAVSNEVPFTLDTAIRATPGICAIQPSAGPKGTPVRIIGDRFGVEKPFVTFYLGKAAAVSSNTNQEANITVPDGALTGPVSLKAADALSNKVNFQVRNCNESPDICASGKEQCCPTGECRPLGDSCGVKALATVYAWQSSTGLIPTAPRVIEECATSTVPSPSPWNGRAGGDQAPVDATVYMRYSRILQKDTVLLGSFRFFRCTSKSTEPCTTQEKVDFTLSQGVEGTDQYVVELTPVTSFATGTTYEVKVLSTVKAAGADGATMEVQTRCGTGPGGEKYGYCFRFRTRATSDPSKVGSVTVAPSTYVMKASGETAPYKAVPLDAADRCIVLNCRKFDWDWYTGTKTAVDARASITNVKSAGKGLCEQTVTGISETLKVPVPINAEIVKTGPAGFGNLFVNFLPPKVEAYFPNCQQACSNALVWAQFTGELDEASVKKGGNVEIRKCRSENCVESELSTSLALGGGAIDLVPVFKSTETTKRVITVKPVSGGKILLEPGAFYRVLLKGGPGVPDGIKGKNGVPMEGANHPLGFQWTFRVKLGADAICKADRVDVVPLEKYETVVGARQLFTATAVGKPDECSANGQTIVPLTPALWTATDAKIADIYRIGTQLVDTGAELSPGCSGVCRATGASAQFGKVAVCGNGDIETTDAGWCAKIGGAGGKCVTMDPGSQAGEECEPSINGALCDPTSCVFRPVKLVTQPGGTCGDGKTDAIQGETCDFGFRCTGGSRATSTTPVPEYASCTTDAEKTACSTAGGVCGAVDYRGCSANCRHLGSVAGKSTCGNSDPLGDGKDCDDGNTTNGDGCSNICLHEGSAPVTVLPAVCGNAILEPGEICEKPSVAAPWSAVPGCNAKSCVHTGTLACAKSVDASCCGNGKIEAGEDCDDGDTKSGNGCSSSCLLEGSSITYANAKGELAPSFCGNGVLEQGEQCESGGLSSNKVAEAIGYTGISPSVSAALSSLARPQKGDGLSDPSQLAYIIGETLPGESGLLATDLSVSLEGQKGKAKYGLQCGLKDEKACPDDTGLDQYGCCAPRPKVDFKYPIPEATGVCRNVLVQGGFNVAMDAGTVVNSFEIAEATSTSKCATGTTQVFADAGYGEGFFAWLHRLWDRAIAFVTGRPVYAERWCKGGVTGQLNAVGATTSTKLFALTLDRALAKNTKYRIRFIGDGSTSTDPLADNADLSKKWGVKTARGVVRENTNDDKAGPLIWTFTTSDKICSVNVITIADTTPDPKLPERPHPFLFVNKDNKPETRSFSAQAQSIQSGIAVPLTTTGDYLWKWLPWTSGDTKLVEIVSPTDAKPSTAASSKQANGTTMLTAGIEVQTDTVNVPPTTSSTVKGVAPVTVLACQSPWPSLGASPLKDSFGSPNFKPGDPFAAGPLFFNFSTMYCRDAGKVDAEDDDLPSLVVNQVKPSILDYSLGILRQYLFTYPDESAMPKAYQGLGLKQDGIGIRIVSNPQHLSPEEWYESRGFRGTPSALLVDGYPAIKDGTTVYVAATNRPQGSTGKIYSNIYLISYNDGAKPVTVQIFEQMVKYLTFNINKEFTDQSNVCIKPLGAPFTSPDVNGGAPISCLADWECLRYDPSLHCDSTKWKLIRDTLRLVDFQYITRVLEDKKDSQGRYPQLSGGTFLQSQTNSIWSSWASELGAAAGVNMPKDPLNKFLTCGQCEKTKGPCQTDADCPSVSGGQKCAGGVYEGGVWKFDPNIDPQSCWNQTKHAFICPSIPDSKPYGVSRLYRYLSLSGGLRYDLGSEFEIPPEPGSDGKPKLDVWWSPPLAQARYECANPPVQGTACANSMGDGGDDRLCRPCPNGNCNTCQSGADAGKFCSKSSDCAGSGIVCAGDDKVAVVVGSCRQVGGSLSFSNICQNVAVGDTGRCGDGVVNPPEKCEVGMTSSAVCTTTDGKPGHKKQVCDVKDCSKYIDDPMQPQCVADAQCGNARIDKTCLGGTSGGVACSTSSDCPGGGTCKAEACDDGSLNGKYGRCNVTCNGYAGYCGDGEISPGETCDLASKNGGYCGLSGSECFDSTKSCAFDCKGSGPYCGNTTIDGPEECDGQTDVTQSAICSSGGKDVVYKRTCTKNEDCGTSGVCGGDVVTKSCVGFTIVDPKTGLAYETQHVRVCNAPGAGDQCAWPVWSECKQRGSCGDGIVDAGESCDAGKANSDTGACTTQCKKNICGDGKSHLGVEECDNGADNGKVTCSADYGSSCLSCTTSCKWQATAGGYCGDGIKNGPEQCDAKDGIDGVTCESLGYDFSKQSIVIKGKSGFEPISVIFDTSTSTDTSTSAGAVECASGCAYTGCARCTDPIDDPLLKTSVSGRVQDGVFTNKSVPNARVTLLYRGVKVAETYTKDDGTFRFDQLHKHPACNAYKIVVDYYGDNPKTTEYDESLSGGYWPFTSNAFAPKDFKTIGIENTDGIIFLLPRVSKFETLVTVNWLGSLEGDIDAHLILPTGYAYSSKSTVDPFPPTNSGEAFCAIKPSPPDLDKILAYSSCTGKDCQRDIFWDRPGLRDLSRTPHARLFCYRFGSDCEVCANFNKPPEVFKFSRKFATGGDFDFYLSDYFNAYQGSTKNYTNPLKLKVTIVTQSGIQEYRPDAGKWGKVWKVFSQDAGSGEILFRNVWMTKDEALKEAPLEALD